MSNTEQGRSNFRDLPKWQRYLICILAAGSISGFFIYYTWEAFIVSYSYENWERTTGTVVRVQRSTGIGGASGARRRGEDSLTVEIEVNGEVFSNNYRIRVRPDSVRLRSRIAVRFDPNNPNRIVRDIPPRSLGAIYVKPILFTLLVFAAIVSNFRIIAPRKRAFSLETSSRKYSNEELNVHLFEEIISSRPDLWDFMVLEPDKPIKGSIFIQVNSPQATISWPPKFILEISLGNTKTGAKMYRLATVDKNIVLKHIIDYWQGQIIPDISLWEEVALP